MRAWLCYHAAVVTTALVCGLIHRFSPSLLSISAASARGDDAQARVDALFAPWNKPGSPGGAGAVIRGGKVILAQGTCCR